MRREHIAPGYDPALDRRPPQPMRRILIVFFLAIAGVLAVLIYMGARVVNGSSEPVSVPTMMVLPPTNTASATPSRTPTMTLMASPDAWGATGTALARATQTETPTQTPEIDYCGWLTPSPTPFPTLEHTPDAWGATGTAVWELDHPTATPWGLPRELCLEVPQWTPTFTPYPLPRIRALGAEATAEASPVGALPPDIQPIIDAAVAYAVAATIQAGLPTQEVRTIEVPVEVPGPERIVEQQVEVQVPVEVPIYMTVPPIYITAPPIVITATASSTPVATDVPYVPLTLVPTYTNTPTATPTSTPTATGTAVGE